MFNIQGSPFSTANNVDAWSVFYSCVVRGKDMGVRKTKDGNSLT